MGGRTPPLWDRVEPEPPRWRRCPVALRSETDGKGHSGSLQQDSQNRKGEGAVKPLNTHQDLPSQH